MMSRGRYDDHFHFDIETNTAFPGKLFQLIEGSTDHAVVSWLPNGLSFAIHDQARFAEMLPRYFKHKKISSFQRQLNLYGFRRDKVQSSYFHAKFQRGRRDLISSIRRIPTKGAASTDQSKMQAEEDKQGQGKSIYFPLRNGGGQNMGGMQGMNGLHGSSSSSNGLPTASPANDILNSMNSMNNPFDDTINGINGVSGDEFNPNSAALMPDSWMNVHHHVNGASGVNLKRGRVVLGAQEYVPPSSLKEPLRRIPLPSTNAQSFPHGTEAHTDKESISSTSTPDDIDQGDEEMIKKEGKSKLQLDEIHVTTDTNNGSNGSNTTTGTGSTSTCGSSRIASLSEFPNQMKVKKSKITANVGYYKYVEENQIAREHGGVSVQHEPHAVSAGGLPPNRRWGHAINKFENDFMPTPAVSSSDLPSLSSLEVGNLFSNDGQEELLYLSQSTLDAMQENHRKDELSDLSPRTSMAIIADKLVYMEDKGTDGGDYF